MEMSIDNNQTSKELLLEAQAHVWQQNLQFHKLCVSQMCMELGIPEIIHKHSKPMSVLELVTNLSIEPARSRSIHTLMRILAHSGFFEESEQGFSLTPSSRLLLKEDPLNTRAFLQVLHPVLTSPFHSLSDWFKNGDQNASAFDTTHGRNFWEYTAEEPRIGNLFNEAMDGNSRLITDVLVKDCKGVFQGLSSLVDVGGGTGTMSEAIGEAFPQLNVLCLIYYMWSANLQGSKNMDFLGGDMFEGIPPADAILLEWILHDWSDEECVKILKKCEEAL